MKMNQINQKEEKKKKKESKEEDIKDGLFLQGDSVELVCNNEKKLILKANKIDFDKPFYLLGDKAYGVIKLSEPAEINEVDFIELADLHKVSTEDCVDKWKGSWPLYAYAIESFVPFDEPKDYKRRDETIYENVEFVEDLDESRHRRDQCMECSESPFVEVLWANGHGHAWFCNEHFKEWCKEHGDDILSIKEVKDGEAAKKFSENSNPTIKKDEYIIAVKLLKKRSQNE